MLVDIVDAAFTGGHATALFSNAPMFMIRSSRFQAEKGTVAFTKRGTKNAGTEPYKAILGVGFPLRT